MEIAIWFIKNNELVNATIDLPENDFNIYNKLKIRLVEDIENIKLQIFELADKYNTSRMKPSIPDEKDKIKCSKLVRARRENIIAIDTLKSLLSYENGIICERCGHIMYRTPLNTPYKKFGTTLLLDNALDTNVEFIFKCSNDVCHYSIDEKCFSAVQNNRFVKQQLLEAGETFVPDDFGMYYDTSVERKEAISRALQKAFY